MKHSIRLLCHDSTLERIVTLLLTSQGYTVSSTAAHCPVIVDLDSAELPQDKKNTSVIGVTRDPEGKSADSAAKKCRAILHRPVDFAKLLAAVADAVDNGNIHTYSPPRSHRLPDLSLNTAELMLSCGDHQVKLTPGEAALFSILSENRGQPVSMETLSEAVGNSRSNKINVHICALRRKLGQIYPRQLITTVRGLGYKML